MTPIDEKMKALVMAAACDAIRQSVGEPEEGGHWYCMCCQSQSQLSKCEYCVTPDFLVPYALSTVEAFDLMNHVDDQIRNARNFIQEAFGETKEGGD